jgi:glycosyltransferase involved in cell wall biosynthesis
MRAEAAGRAGEAAGQNAAHAPKLPVLLVLPIVPWPLRRNGSSLRYAPIVEYLAQRYELDVLILTEEEEVLPSSGPLLQCHSLVITRVPISSLPPWLRKLRTIWGSLSPWGAPLGTLGFSRRKLERTVLSYLEHKKYSVVIWAVRHLDTAVRIRRKYAGTRFVIDICDSPTLWSLRDASTHLIHRILTRYSSWKWRRLERKAQEVFDAAIYISNVDARTVSPRHNSRIHVIPNGTSHADVPPLVTASSSSKVIGFLGDMTYQPNISAVLRLAQRIFPRIVAKQGDATLLIIGRDPAPAIRRLQCAAISVTGTVDDIWPYIARANIFVFPMIEGTGLQNKILETMYAGVPIVTTSIAANGIGAKSGEQLLVADADDEIAEQALKVMGDAQYAARLAERARTFVMREFSWPAILPRYEAIVAPPEYGL